METRCIVEKSLASLLGHLKPSVPEKYEFQISQKDAVPFLVIASVLTWELHVDPRTTKCFG
jgi:hypothetical protein